MKKPQALAVLTLGLACLFLVACKTAGTPKQSDDKPTKTRAAAGTQEPPPAESPGQKKGAIRSGDARPASSVQRKDLKVGATSRTAKPSIKAVLKKIGILRAILYATLAIILVAVIGAIAAERAGRHRRPTPAPAP